ncbi:hypothetical protein HYALB_00013809 [Hymenoscyphus albidus]|uniref:Peptide hydrolase n=1 Tax=Hymenoscyphus albidus TaxID=595503 RepID=A0A9N9LZF0_9HELO|nr:hypothetical protein HYALB_00013809 [Hymenoscyphus albidus]
MKLSQLVFGFGVFASTFSCASPTDTRPLRDSNKLRRLLTRSALLSKAKTLQNFAYDTPKRNRQIGTPGHNATINWIYDTINQFPDYYESYLQPYDMLLHEDANLTVNGKALEVYSLGMSPSGKAKGPVVHIPNLGCDKATDLTGKIALILRGDCQSAVKDAYAGAANASGVLIYNTGNAIYSTMNGYSLQLVSTPEGPGVNDNGSGSNTLLEIAVQLTNFSINNAVRFSWWTAEEPGLLGATYYVAHLNQSGINKIRLLLNFDMLASPNYAYQIYDGDGSAFNSTGPPGSAEAEHAFQDYFTNEAHQGWTETEFDGRSDYGPFLDVSIACGGLFTGAEGNKTVQEAALFGGEAGKPYDVNYHLAGDNATNLNIGAWIENTKAIAHVLAGYARSFDSLPPRNVSVAAKREVLAKRGALRKRGSPRY